MNIKRGFFRIWIVLACFYYLLVLGLLIAQGKDIYLGSGYTLLTSSPVEEIINCDDQEWGTTCERLFWGQETAVFKCMKENFYKLPLEERTRKNFNESKKKNSSCIKTEKKKEIYSYILENIYLFIAIAFLPFLLFIIFYILGKIYKYIIKGFKR